MLPPYQQHLAGLLAPGWCSTDVCPASRNSVPDSKPAAPQPWPPAPCRSEQAHSPCQARCPEASPRSSLLLLYTLHRPGSNHKLAQLPTSEIQGIYPSPSNFLTNPKLYFLVEESPSVLDSLPLMLCPPHHPCSSLQFPGPQAPRRRTEILSQLGEAALPATGNPAPLTLMDQSPGCSGLKATTLAESGMLRRTLRPSSFCRILPVEAPRTAQSPTLSWG